MQDIVASFDFIAHESLHTAHNEEYVFAPVIQVETRENSTIQSTGSGTALISGGTVRTNIRVGMDLNGTLGVGLSIPSNLNITLGSGGLVRIGA